MSSKGTAFDPIVLSAVVVKCLFSSSRSIRRGLGQGLGFKILWITRQTSRDLLEESAFSVKDFRAERMTYFGLFLTKR